MINFEFVQKLHALVEQFPDRQKEYEILYPDAFAKKDITGSVHFKMIGCGNFKDIEIFYRNRVIGKIRPHQKIGYFIQHKSSLADPRLKDTAKETTFNLFKIDVEAGYEAAIHQQDYTGKITFTGIRFYRYGDNEAIDLEFNPNAAKNRITEKA